MDREEFVEFVRRRGLAVVATCAEGVPEAALVGITATDEAELVLDTSSSSRKFRNLQRSPRVAVVIGWEDEVTVQCEGVTDIPSGDDRARCLEAYFGSTPTAESERRTPTSCTYGCGPAGCGTATSAPTRSVSPRARDPSERHRW